ncbi:MAG: UDP-N-acetylmuramoyl-L-alanine--D-glutamate ligase [Candidatus Paceibacterota bacterium]
MILKNKRILLVGLGRLGGGVAAAQFFIEQGARLTVSDALSEDILKNSLQKLKGLPITYILGVQTPKNIHQYDGIVCNQAVSIRSEVVHQAKKHNIPFFNDFTLFLNLLNTQSHQPYIGVTGTRGKTTITTWVGHILSPAIVGGNIPRQGSFTVFKKITHTPQRPVVLELSSFQLEYIQKKMEGPRVAVISNLYQDHLNRHGTMKEYVRCKSQIFLNQTKKDILILNADNAYTKEFLTFKPKAQIWMVSRKKLKRGVWGMYAQNDILYFQNTTGVQEIIRIPKSYKNHHTYNLMQALCAARAYGKEWSQIIQRVETLPQIPFRQEIVMQNKHYTVINDSAATSPEGTVAAVTDCLPQKGPYALICGGTDKQLDFTHLARSIKKYVDPQRLFLLQGSGTQKLITALQRERYILVSENIHETLKELIITVQKKTSRGHIIFSPACASFEKFKNEFDRGRKFTSLAKKYFM